MYSWEGNTQSSVSHDSLEIIVILYADLLLKKKNKNIWKVAIFVETDIFSGFTEE